MAPQGATCLSVLSSNPEGQVLDQKPVPPQPLPCWASGWESTVQGLAIRSPTPHPPSLRRELPCPPVLLYLLQEQLLHHLNTIERINSIILPPNTLLTDARWDSLHCQQLFEGRHCFIHFCITSTNQRKQTGFNLWDTCHDLRGPG